MLTALIGSRRNELEVVRNWAEVVRMPAAFPAEEQLVHKLEGGLVGHKLEHPGRSSAVISPCFRIFPKQTKNC